MAEDFDVEAMLEAPYVKSVSVIHSFSIRKHVSEYLGENKLVCPYGTRVHKR